MNPPGQSATLDTLCLIHGPGSAKQAQGPFSGGEAGRGGGRCGQTGEGVGQRPWGGGVSIKIGQKRSGFAPVEGEREGRGRGSGVKTHTPAPFSPSPTALPPASRKVGCSQLGEFNFTYSQFVGHKSGGQLPGEKLTIGREQELTTNSPEVHITV